MLPQPPPNAPLPPPSEAAICSHRKWKWLWIVGILSILILAGLSQPQVIRSHRKSDQTEAIIHARQIGLALFEFESEYGNLPDVSTISAVRRKTDTLLPLGAKTSNDYFRQLIASGYFHNEGMFFAKREGMRKPDGLIEGSHALEKGECGFSYLVGLSSRGNPARPLLVAPLIPGTDRFDSTVFDGMAVILKFDNSVTVKRINEDGHVLTNGKNLLDPTNPVWGSDEKWHIAWPD